MDMARYWQLNKLNKHQLAAMHMRYGGIMPLAVYLRWTKEELIETVLRDEKSAAEYAHRND